MKVVRVVFKVLLWIAGVIVAAVLTLPLWFGPIVKTVANAIVPGVVKTDFHIGHLSLNPYTARFELGDLQLFNPPGYSEKYAVTVGDVAFDAKTFSVMTDVVHVEEIKIKDIFVSYVDGGSEKVNNFTQIQYNVAGGKEKYEAAQSEKAAVDGTVQDNPPPAQETDVRRPEKRYIIDRLEISGLVVQFGLLPIRVPMALVLKDIGLKTGGATVSEVFQDVWAEILKQAGVIGDQLKAFGLDTADKTKKQVGELLGGTSTQAADAINTTVDNAKKALDSFKGLW